MFLSQSQLLFKLITFSGFAISCYFAMTHVNKVNFLIIKQGSSMTVKVAINGFGRIGRNVLRALIENPRQDVEVIAINTIPSIADSAYLLEFDSVHGRLPTPISINNDIMHVGGKKIKFFSERDPERLDWETAGVDIVMECTGHFTDAKKASLHLKGGAKKVVQNYLKCPTIRVYLDTILERFGAEALASLKLVSNLVSIALQSVYK